MKTNQYSKESLVPTLEGLEEHADLIQPAEYPGARDIVSQALSELPPRWAQILCLRFGLFGVGVHTLSEIAKIQGVTPEPIRQLESKALRRLRGEGFVEFRRDGLCEIEDVPC